MITKNIENKLLKRNEVELVVESPSNPGMQKATEIVSENLKSSAENIAVKKINSRFGRNSFTIEAFVYQSKEDKDKIEPKPKAKKEAPK